MRSPAEIFRVGSWKTTRSIGRKCKAGDRLSRPVLTAERLDHPDPTPSHERATIADGPSPPLPTILVSQQAFSRSNGDRRVEWSTHPNPRSCIDHAHPESRATRLNALAARFPGDHTRGATPVPIPNTAVKPAGPMIVQSRESRSSPGPYFKKPHGSPGSVGLLAARIALNNSDLKWTMGRVRRVGRPNHPSIFHVVYAVPRQTTVVLLAAGHCGNVSQGRSD